MIPEHLDDEAKEIWAMASHVVERSSDPHLVMTALWIRRQLRSENAIAIAMQTNRIATLESALKRLERWASQEPTAPSPIGVQQWVLDVIRDGLRKGAAQ